MKHTELPWHIGGDGADIFSVGKQENQSDAIHIADVQPENSGLLGMSVVDAANAAFIVKAVNNHERLLEALKDLEIESSFAENKHHDLEDSIMRAKEAIKQAEDL